MDYSKLPFLTPPPPAPLMKEQKQKSGATHGLTGPCPTPPNLVATGTGHNTSCLRVGGWRGGGSVILSVR